MEYAFVVSTPPNRSDPNVVTLSAAMTGNTLQPHITRRTSLVALVAKESEHMWFSRDTVGTHFQVIRCQGDGGGGGGDGTAAGGPAGGETLLANIPSLIEHQAAAINSSLRIGLRQMIELAAAKPPMTSLQVSDGFQPCTNLMASH
jgi:hypothetical protein